VLLVLFIVLLCVFPGSTQYISCNLRHDIAYCAKSAVKCQPTILLHFDYWLAASSPKPIITCCSVVPPEKFTRKDTLFVEQILEDLKFEIWMLNEEDTMDSSKWRRLIRMLPMTKCVLFCLVCSWYWLTWVFQEIDCKMGFVVAVMYSAHGTMHRWATE